MTALNEATLHRLDPRVAVPTYRRGAVRRGIVHLGVGGFHRSHQAMYVDALMNGGHAHDWGIHGVGVQPSNSTMRDALGAQDNLYTLVVRHNEGTWEPRVIGSIVGYSLAPDEPATVLDALADPGVRLVSLTVTEGGYSIDPVTGAFDPSTPAVAADLRGDAAPTTVFGLVTEALARRRRAGTPAFTVVSCDNVQGNGTVARDTFTGFARLRDPALATWIADHVAFPNSMVDRITPQTTEHDRAELASRFGVDDRWPVVCEPFTQWVLEDSFVAGRPDLGSVGVQLVDDVEPYELMKLRLLNASHQALAYPARLLGLRLVHEAATDPLLSAYLLDYMTHEAIPTLRPVQGVDLPGYASRLVERFANPEVGDTVERLCANTSDLVPKFLLPVVRANLAAHRPIVRSTAVVAFWATDALGVDEHGHRHELDDNRAEHVHRAATRARDDPATFLRDNRALFGDLVDDARFTDTFTALLRSVQRTGVRATLAAVAGGHDTAPITGDSR